MDGDGAMHDGGPEESPFLKKARRIYVLIIALFLAALLILNSNAGYHAMSVAAGKIVTSTLAGDSTFELKNGGKVFFENSTYDTLKEIYLGIQKTEFKACLTGEKNGRDYLVKGIYIPQTYSMEVFSVAAVPCSRETIISLHSHPYLRCIFSNQDIENLNIYRKVNNDMILGLMCDIDKITFYGYS